MSSGEHEAAGAVPAPPAPGAAAHAIDLVKTYGTGDAVVHALSGVTVEFERGCFTAVMGPS
jgi:putative ABC transport system ATP-binding protein